MAGTVKVTLNGTTLIDHSDATVAPDKVLSSYVAYEGDGDRITGTYTPSAGNTHTATFVGTKGGRSGNCYVEYGGQTYINGNPAQNPQEAFQFNAGETLTCYSKGSDTLGVSISDSTGYHNYLQQTYQYTLPDRDINIELSYGSESLVTVTVLETTISITANGNYDVADYTQASVNVPMPTIGPLSVTANGTYTSSNGGYSPVVVNVQQQTDLGVRFLDYDGTVLHTYTKSEFANLSAMPANPSHTGLTAQGWNWALADAQEYVASYGQLDIGQMYTTASGKTEIDWGDNSAPDTLTGNSLTQRYTIQHVYPSSGGNYTIKISATSGSSYSFYNNNNTAILAKTATDSGENANRMYTRAVKHVRVGADAQINASAFYNCTSLEDISIPNTTDIKGYAFYNCRTLKFVTVPTSATNGVYNYTYRYCYNLEAISLPKQIGNISTYAFSDCTNLGRVAIAPSTTIINTYAFNECRSLKKAIIPDSVTSIAQYAFSLCTSLENVYLSHSITSLGNYTFQSCFSLEEIAIPASCTTIGSYAFAGCYSIKSVNIPSTVQSLGAYAFQNCLSMETAILYGPTGTMGTYMFSGCMALKTVILPQLTQIPAYCFSNCKSLESIVIPNTVTVINNYAFSSCLSLKSIQLPSATTTVYSYAFSNCYSLESVTGYPSTETIQQGMFMYCQSLKEFTIPSAVTTINSSSFTNCYALSKITIPAGVTTIGNQAFQGCGLGELHFLAETPASLGTSPFGSLPTDCKIYVPTGSLEAYTTATNYPSAEVYTYIEE